MDEVTASDFEEMLEEDKEMLREDKEMDIVTYI
jgi:hypothetical protein